MPPPRARPHDTDALQRARAKLAEWRDQRCYTQRELARDLGMSEANISAMLKGTRRLSVRVIEAAARLAGRPLAEAFHAPGEELRALRPDEAETLRYLRTWPVSVRSALLDFLRYWADEPPVARGLRRTHELLRQMPDDQRRLVEAYATMLREGGLPPDIRAALGRPSSTDEQS